MDWSGGVLESMHTHLLRAVLIQEVNLMSRGKAKQPVVMDHIG